MFKTMLEAELKPDYLNIGSGFQFWSCVELGYLWPWFQVEMLSNISDEAWIEKVLLVSPSTVNGSSDWQMDPLLKMIVVKGGDSVIKGYEYRVKDRSPFVIGEIPDNVAPENIEVVYLAEKYLGR